MAALRILGLVALLAGVIAQPMGWMFSHWITPFSALAIVIGVCMIYMSRSTSDDADVEAISGSPRSKGRAMPGDVHGYSGQLDGGRSTSWKSQNGSGAGGSDNGGGDGGGE